VEEYAERWRMVGAAHAHMLARADAMCTYDARGRMVQVNQWDGGAPSRFHLHRSADAVFCRFRADVPDALAAELEALVAREPPGDLEALPAQRDAYERLLAPIERTTSGPVFAFPDVIDGGADAASLKEGEANLLQDDLAPWRPDLPHRKPFFVSMADGRVACVCASVRISSALHEAGVETALAFRKRGHAVQTVAAWALAVRALGVTPSYSTRWDNHASRATAERLGLQLIGSDFSVT
jgi:hypothetical protein